MEAKDAQELQKQVGRLQKMEGSKMKPELQNWMKRRLVIVNKLIKGPSKEEEEEL